MQPGPTAPTPAPSAGVPEGTLRIYVLGGLRIARDERELADSDWRLSKARSIVKLLALAPGHQLHREYLIELLWPDLSPAAADNNFHQALHSARRALATIFDERLTEPALRLRQGIVTIHPDIPLWIDVEAFATESQAAISSGDRALYYAAIDLYRGELLPEDRYEEWAAPQRETLQQLFLDLLRRLGRLHEAQREPTSAVDVYRRIVALDPIAEGAHTGLMRLYAQTGRRQQALRQFERLRDALAAELDTEPEAATERLYLDILDNRYPIETLTDPVPPTPPLQATAPALPERPTTFVDRIGEMQRLLGFLDRVLAGEGQVVVVGGEPGIGKTRLTEEFAARARQRGALVLWGRCHEDDGAPAFWPWTQMIRNWLRDRDAHAIANAMGAGAADIARVLPELRQHLPDLPDPLAVGADNERYRLYTSVTDFLRSAARNQPLALLIDDLHWADRSSLLLLEFLLNELAEIPIIVVGTYRDIGIDRGHPLTRFLAALNRFEDERRLLMTGFGPGDVAQMAEVTSGHAPPAALTAAIHAQTEGNPFFVREVVRLLVDEGRYDQEAAIGSWRVTVPQGVRETIGLRLGNLSDDAMRLLTVAAVAGREFDLPIVAMAADSTIDEALDLIDEGLATAIIEEDDRQPDRLRFAHTLIRHTLYDETSRVRRIRLHRRVGDAIEQIHADDLDPWLAELAGHFVACATDGDPEKGVRYSIQAGQQSMSQVAYGEAVDQFRQALRLVESSAEEGNERHAELLLLLADALRYDGETHEARATYSRAAEIAASAEQPELFARVALGIALTEGEAVVDDETTIRLLERALLLLPDDPSILRAASIASLSGALQYHDPGSLPRRRALSREAVEMARQVGDPATLATALYAQLEAEWEPLDLASSLAITAEILELAGIAGDGSLALILHSRRLSHHIVLGDVVAADDELVAYMRIAQQLRLPYNLWSATYKQSMRALMSGRFDEAERLTLEAYRIGERSAPLSAHPLYLVQQFVLLRERGNLESIETDLRRYAADNLPSFRFERCLLAIICCETGRAEEAHAEVRQIVGDGIESIPADIFWLGVLALLADICCQLAELDYCRDLYRLLTPFAGRIANSGTAVITIGPVSYFLGLLAAALGDTPGAEQHFQDAIDLSLRVGALPSAETARFALASVLARRNAPGDDARSSKLLAECEQAARTLGMTNLLERINHVRLNVADPLRDR